MASPRPTSIINPPTGQRLVMYRNGDTGDIVRVIMFGDKLSSRYIRPQNVERLRGANDYATLRNVYWFVKDNIRYKADEPGHEEVRSPGYLFQTRQGDCKSMTLAMAAICRALGIPFRYRFIKQSSKSNFHHTYLVAVLPGGREVVLDAVNNGFDREFNFSKKLDLRPGQPIPAGISGIGNIRLQSILPLILMLIIWFAFAEKIKK